ncbi:hypothetical protein ONO86_05264 [Micromonospora noduli]|nr:hypothetical protein ONO86_05264 [Micromonospora noduli]
MVAGFAPRSWAQRWITSWFAVIKLRPGRSGRSAIDEITCELRTDRPVPRPVRTPPAAVPPPVDGVNVRLAAALLAGAVRFAVVRLAAALLAGAVRFAVVRLAAALLAGAVRFAAGRAGAFFAGAFRAGAVRAVAVLRAAVVFRAAAVFRAAVVLLAAVLLRAAVDVAAVVFFAAVAFFAGALFAAAVDFRPAVAFVAAARFAGALLFAGAAFARLDAGLAADFLVAAARPADALVPAARPDGPVLLRPAPARIERTSCFTSSGLRSAEIPETPRLRSCPRMSSTRIREISDSETPGVPGVWLPACRFVLVAVAPRPELFR